MVSPDDGVVSPRLVGTAHFGSKVTRPEEDITTQPTPSDHFWSNVHSAVLTRRRRLVARVKSRDELPEHLIAEGQDLDIFLDAVADGRVTIVPRAE